MAVWQINEAKSRFTELLDAADLNGPQFVLRDGAECAVVLSIGNYRALTAPKPNLCEYLLEGPKDDSFDVPRDSDVDRNIEL